MGLQSQAVHLAGSFPHQRLGRFRLASREPRGARQVSQAGKHDPWSTLGVEPGAEEHEIKRAYRKLVLRTHPDHHLGDEGAQERFIDIQQAYESLVRKAQGKGSSGSRMGDDWDFHDWFWNFSRSRKWAKQRPEAAAFKAAQPGEISQQLAGLRRKAAFRRARPGQDMEDAPAPGQSAAAAAMQMHSPAEHAERGSPFGQPQPAQRAISPPSSSQQASAGLQGSLAAPAEAVDGSDWLSAGSQQAADELADELAALLRERLAGHRCADLALAASLGANMSSLSASSLRPAQLHWREAQHA